MPQYIHRNKRAILWAKIPLLPPSTSLKKSIIEKVVKADINNFIELAELAGLNIYTDLSAADLSYANLTSADLSYANLSGADLRSADLSFAILSGADLNDADVKNARFCDNKSISQEMKRDLMARGAIFEDAPGDRSFISSSKR